MDARLAVCATVVGAFVMGAAGGALVANGLQGVAAGVAVFFIVASLAIALVGLYAFKHRDRG